MNLSPIVKCTVLIFLTLLMPVAGRSQQGKVQALTALKQRYSERVLALKKKDMQSIKVMLAKGFTFLDVIQGKSAESTEKMFLQIQGVLPSLLADGISLTYNIDDLVLVDKIATVKLSQVMTKKNMKNVDSLEETWIKMGSKWYLKRVVFRSGKMYKEGKLIRVIPKPQK